MHTCACMLESSLLAYTVYGCMKIQAKVKIATHQEYVGMGLQKRRLRIIRKVLSSVGLDCRLQSETLS